MDRLLLLFGDQLDAAYLSHAGLDPARDGVMLAEVAAESTGVPSHVQRTILFLASMRHFAVALERSGWSVRYVRLTDPDNTGTLRGEISRACAALQPRRLLSIRPGDWRVRFDLERAAAEASVPLAILEDPHFFLDTEAFGQWAKGRRVWVMEHFYRFMRRRLDLLRDGEGRPIGGRWSLDAANRARLGPGAPRPPAPVRFAPDAVTREAAADVARLLPDLPGRGDGFGWPVTREQALAALGDFVTHRLPHFGTYQDAMHSGEPWLFHSLISAPLNLKLLRPHECVAAAVKAWEHGDAPLNSVEGFVRQIVGWREFVHGVYHRLGPTYGERNALDQHGRLPTFYWTATTEMVCVRASVEQVLAHGYGHHIQRLMVTGNLALTAGVHPRAVSDWYLGMFVDGVDWVTLPNTLGMAMHADGGVVGTKPYVATGRYIARMSDYCTTCRYRPAQATGPDACPLTTLYWAFLARNRARLSRTARMVPALRNLDRLDAADVARIAVRADALREEWGVAGGGAGAL
jgi:deoxyribodipyrimidine photolyase-related protein